VAIEDALKFLSFEDWLRRKEHHRTDWIVVSRHCEKGEKPTTPCTASSASSAG
jgi:hypothetical protein